MNILVFGGTRFMGKHLVNALILEGHNVTLATRGITEDNFDNRVARIHVNRTSFDSLRKNIPKLVYDVVFDNLAYCSNDVKYLLDTVQCNRYIQISSASVYKSLHNNTKEIEFDASKEHLIYCNREDFTYDEGKRQAECAIVKDYGNISSAIVRFPFVIGEDDYTGRLLFYVEHIMKRTPIFINNLSASMGFIRSGEAGKFLAFLADKTFTGTINAANEGTISIAEIADYVKEKTGKTIVLEENAEIGSYNGAENYYLNIDKAKSLGYSFTWLSEWIYDLIDYYILLAGNSLPLDKQYLK